MRRKQPSDVFKLLDMSGGKDACWPFRGELNDKGLPYIQIGGKKHVVYRLTRQLVFDDLGDKQLGRHTCDNGADPNRVRGWVCCNPHHVIPGSVQDNSNDMTSRDRHGLNAHVVRAIRKLLEQGRTHEQIGELYGVSRQAITDIANGTTHGHVT